MNLDVVTIINIGCVIASVVFFMARLEATTKANQAFYKNCLEELHTNIDNKFTFLEKNIDEKFAGVNERFHNIKSDIDRLEKKQEESNKIKERLAIVEYAVKDISHKVQSTGIADAYEVAYKEKS